MSKRAQKRINWQKIKAVIFDVDGTLYDQQKLHQYMLIEFLKFYALRPWRLWELKILYDFRNEREKRALKFIKNIKKAQYQWTARASGVSLNKVKKVVNKWIYNVPLKYLYSCRLNGIEELFLALKKKRIIIVIFSDHPAKKRLVVLRLAADHVFSAVDQNINRLKPHPKGLLVIKNTLKIPAKSCLFVGNRYDHDKACAKAAKMPYFIIDKGIHGKGKHFQIYYQWKKQLRGKLFSKPAKAQGLA